MFKSEKEKKDEAIKKRAKADLRDENDGRGFSGLRRAAEKSGVGA